MKRFGFILLLISMLLFACNRSFGPSTNLTTPAVNTLIAAGTKPAPPEQALPTRFLPEETPSASKPAEDLPVSTPATSQPSVNEAALYAVIQLGEFDLLNVRLEPGLSSHVPFTLPPQQRDLKPTGQIKRVDEVTWVEVELPEGDLGWVSAQFLTEQVEPDLFCQDTRVEALLERLIGSVKERDGDVLAELVSPAHGLTLYHNVWNPPVRFENPEAIPMLYLSTVDYDWGIQEGSGLPLVGPFKELVYPKLQDVLAYSHTRQCNVLEPDVSVGATTGVVYWPVEYANLNFVALYRQAPEGQELNWRTWVVGIEYVDGLPYIAVLVQFYWEI